MPAEHDLVRELVRLRHGWGLQSQGLRARLGRELTIHCGIADTDGDAEIRDKVRSWLETVSRDLPPELARALVMALGMDRSHQYRYLTLRLGRLASEQLCAPRTARRRADHAIRLAAQAATRRVRAEPVTTVRVPVPCEHYEVLVTFARTATTNPP